MQTRMKLEYTKKGTEYPKNFTWKKNSLATFFESEEKLESSFLLRWAFDKEGCLSFLWSSNFGKIAPNFVVKSDERGWVHN